MKKDSLLYTVIFSFGITFTLVFILSLASSHTEKIVKKNQSIAIARAYLLAGGAAIDEGSDVSKLFKDTFNLDAPGMDPLTANIEGKDIIVSPFSGQGLWGTITGVIALDASFSRIVGLEITSHSETPGLGGRIEEDWFKNQFKGETIAQDIRVVQSGGMGDTDPDNGLLDGVVGATRTSESVQNIINKQIRSLKGDVPFEETLSKEELLRYSYLNAADITTSSEEEIGMLFNDVFSSSADLGAVVRGQINGKNILGTSFTTPGLWGDITGVLLLDSSTMNIVGLEIVSHMEKAGAAISEEWFKEQFRDIKTENGIKVVQGEKSNLNKEVGIVDGISGATTTNTGIQDGINSALNILREEI